ncbi:FtsX-like permease family protein [Butyrivibrio sp. NC3005]|uniref:FtsX-like permease family protein n=1 Tax=Butyrivibrio sp. NC3005 TaxID=1280685 RepID=UPI00041E7216|nr:FtsX-like permease family protein [Butyrivibrio sp. NC3005]
MKQSFWAKIAFKNIFENKKYHLANLIVSVFTVMTLYLYIFMATNPGLNNASGAASLKLILYLGCLFLSVVTLVFKTYTNKIFIKRRNKELGLYAVWGLESKHINSIMTFEALYMYLTSVFLGILLGVLSQRFVYEGLFSLMRCDSKYQNGFMFSNIWITMFIFLGIDFLILMKNKKTIRKQQVITLLKAEDSNKVIKRLKATDFIKGICGLALIVGAYIYVNTVDDLINSISNIFIALVFLFIGSYLVISCFVVMIEFYLKKKDGIYYKNTFFTTIAKLISRTKNNALSLAVINILFTCIVIGASTTIALYLGTDRQASAAYKVDGEINTKNREDVGLVVDAVYEAATEARVDVETIGTMDEYAFQTVFDEENGTFLNDNVSNRSLPEIISFVSLEDFNKSENTNLKLENGEVYFVPDIDLDMKDFDTLNVYGRYFKVKGTLSPSSDFYVDNIKYGYKFAIIVKDYEDIEDIHEYLAGKGNTREIFHYVDYNVSGDIEDETRVETILTEKLKQIESVDYYDSNATQKRTRYEQNAIFLFIGTFISLIFVMYMIFIMYYKQIQEAVDDADNVRIMEKIGMTAGEIKRCIMAENGILFFIPIGMAFFHVIACFKIICDLLKLFMLTDMDFTRICILVFSGALLTAYMIMYYGAYKVYTSIVLQ